MPESNGVPAANYILRFALEMAMLASLSYWGFHSQDGVLAWVLGLGAPVLAAALWGSFMSPKAARPTRDPARILLELAIFGAGVAALGAAGPAWLAVVLGVAVLVHLALTFALDQRGASHAEFRVPGSSSDKEEANRHG